MRYKLRPIMRLLSRRLWHHSGRDSLTALLVFVALGLLAQTAVPPHVHSDGEPGIYNAQCPLAALATTQRELRRLESLIHPRRSDRGNSQHSSVRRGTDPEGQRAPVVNLQGGALHLQ